mmetsp:Transcript_3565/g.5319  ORF Transcript_3565/g.5319 Transcript_3565/m.5319 type:complete len:90 (-) Transcript_3565:192-461(-)
MNGEQILTSRIDYLTGFLDAFSIKSIFVQGRKMQQILFMCNFVNDVSKKRSTSYEFRKVFETRVSTPSLGTLFRQSDFQLLMGLALNLP